MSEGTPPPPPPENPYGSPHPQGGGTPPPPPPGQPGGYTPPPNDVPPPTQPGGYAAAPPPPPPLPPGSGGAYSAPDSFSYGWNKFKAQPSALLVPVLIVVVLLIVVEIIVQILLRATILGTHDCTTTVLGTSVQTQCGPNFAVALIGAGLAGLVVNLIAQALGAGLIKNALNIADGKPASMGEVWKWATNGQVITAALIVSVAVFIGTLLCYLPGLIVAFLLNWTMFFVVDQDFKAMDAVKASVNFVTSHLGETIVFWLLGFVTLLVGALLCGVGLLVAVPVVLVAAAFTYRVLNGRQVTPAA